MNTDKKLSILFVCLGNICRSPLAEAILHHRLDEKGLTDEIWVDSAGTGDWHVGSVADPRSISIAEDNNILLRGKARCVNYKDFHSFDYILAMDRQNLADLKHLQEQHGGKAKVRLFREFDTSAELPMDVPDPYYGGTEGFQDIFIIMDRTCQTIVNRLIEDKGL